MSTDKKPLLIFDGDCGFCTWCADWIARQWGDRARSLAWQAMSEDEMAGMGLCLEDVRSAAWWVDQRGRRYGGARAVAKSLTAARGPARWLGAVILVPPMSWLADAVYPVVSRYRHRLPGATPACRRTESPR